MPVDDWASEFPDPLAKQEEIMAISDYFHDILPVHSAAERFTALTRAADLPGEGLYRIWKHIVFLALEYPMLQDKIVELLAEIEKIPHIEKDGHPFNKYGQDVWSNLPLFGVEMRKLWNYFDPPPSDPDQAVARLEWKNLNAFAARITASHCKKDFKLYGLWSLREALENELWIGTANVGPNEVQPEDLPHERSIHVLPGLVPAAAQWIFHAGRVLFTCQEEILPTSKGGDPMRGGTLWNGKHGFCQERWGLWKKRFEWVQGVDGLDAYTKEVARNAVEEMEKIEKDSRT